MNRKYLLLGQTGVGKSSLINAVLGMNKAPTSRFEPTTSNVEIYNYDTFFGTFSLIDTPGLGEGDSDVVYIQTIKNYYNSNSVDAIWYVSTLKENRFRPQEKLTIQLLTKHLGRKIWSDAWFVLSFAASVPNTQWMEAYQMRYDQISSYIRALLLPDETTFNDFKQSIIIDSLANDWTVNAVPISTIMIATKNFCDPRPLIAMNNPYLIKT